MKLKTWLSAVLSVCLLLTGCLAMVGCQSEDGNGSTTTEGGTTSGGTVTTDPSTSTTEPNVTTEPVETTPGEPVDPIESGPTLSSMTLNHDASIYFRPEEGSYTVTLPAGRPAVPQITAEAADEGAEVTIYQAMFPNDATEAYGRVDVTLGEESNTYWIKFVKSEENGFALQYNDRYTFTPDYTLAEGESFTFRSSNKSIVSVDETGKMTVNMVSSVEVTISALVGDEVKDTLVVSRTYPAQTALFLVTGQSNAAGTFDDNVYSKLVAPLYPEEGISLFTYVAHSSSPESVYVRDITAFETWGFSPALAKAWYDLTGEKTLIIQSAVGGSPIEAWQKGGDKHGMYNNLYDGTLAAYNAVMSTYGKNSNYEFIRTGYFWLQGETGQSAYWNGEEWEWNASKNRLQTGEEYYEIFMENHANFQQDMGVEFGSIAIVRALADVCSEESRQLGLLTDLVPVRAAQYLLNSNTDRTVFVASRIGEIATPQYSNASSGRINHDPEGEGYGYIGYYNLHYSQKGYNAQGIELATGTYNMLCATTDRTATGMEVLAKDGRTRLTDGATVTGSVRDGYQLAAAVLPLWAEGTTITYEITSGENYASVSELGFVSFKDNTPNGTKVTVLVRNVENGFTMSINVVCG